MTISARNRLLAWPLATSVFLFVFLPAALAEPSYVTVKQTRQNMPALVKAIARYGEATTVLIAKGGTLVQAVERHCGQVDPTYLAIATSRSIILSPTTRLSQTTEVELPACIFAPLEREIPLGDATSLSVLARDHGVHFASTAYGGSRRWDALQPVFAYSNDGVVFASFPSGNRVSRAATIVSAITEALAPIRRQTPPNANRHAAQRAPVQNINRRAREGQISSGPIVRFSPRDWRTLTENYYGIRNAETIVTRNNLRSVDEIPDNKPIILPGQIPVSTTVRLDAGVDSAVAVAAIRQAYKTDAASNGHPRASLSRADARKNVNRVKAAFLVSPIQNYKCGTKVGAPWPFDATALIEQIGYNKGFLDLDFTSTPGILILDTGFDFVDRKFSAYFPEANRQKIKSLAPYSVAGRSRQRGAQFVDGLNVAARTASAASFKDDADRWHGLAVAGAALGTRVFEGYRHAFGLPLRLSFVNIVQFRYGAPLIESSGLAEVIRHVENTDVKVINISFLVPGVIRDLDSVLSKHGSGLILVVAAGNDNNSVFKMGTFPAKFGGKFKYAPENATIITVGAHDRDGNKTDFSSYDKSQVDLLAPGCDIASYAGKVSDRGKLSLVRADWAGTSISAPIVSFAAGLLGAYGLKPAEIKARLIVSADVSEALKDFSYSRGRLNILKATSFNFDQFVIRDGKKQVRILVAPQSEHQSGPALENPLVRVCGEERWFRDFAKIARDPKLGMNGKWHLWLNPTPDESISKMERENLCELQKGDYLKLTVNDFVSGKEYKISLDNLLDLIPRR